MRPTPFATHQESAPESRARERRAWVRYPSHAKSPLHVLECDTELGWWARVEDVSQGGMAILLPRRVSPGTVLVIDRPALDGHPARALSMRVVRALANEGGRWNIGCQFSQPLTDEELDALQQPAELRMPTRLTRVVSTMPNTVND